jgi:hypothetical protein
VEPRRIKSRKHSFNAFFVGRQSLIVGSSRGERGMELAGKGDFRGVIRHFVGSF